MGMDYQVKKQIFKIALRREKGRPRCKDVAHLLMPMLAAKAGVQAHRPSPFCFQGIARICAFPLESGFFFIVRFPCFIKSRRKSVFQALIYQGMDIPRGYSSKDRAVPEPGNRRRKETRRPGVRSPLLAAGIGRDLMRGISFLENPMGSGRLAF